MARNLHSLNSNQRLGYSTSGASHQFVLCASNKNPTAIVVSPPLSGETFPLGPTLMKQALISKNKYRFIVDTIQVPNVGDPSNQAWERSISLIHSWILDTLLPSMAQSVVYIKIKKKCFSCLEWFERNIFSRRSLSNCWVTRIITWFKPGALTISE